MSASAKRVAWLAFAAVVLVFFLMLAAAIGLWVPGVDVAFYLLVGWAVYLRRVVPQVEVRWDLVATTALYGVALAIGLHLFLRWLVREMGVGPWRWRSTLGLLVIVLLMFAAGTAMVGVVHQTTWLVRSPEPMYRRGGIAANRIKCASNLKQIGLAINLYAQTNGGKYPDDFSQLLAAGEVTAEVFLCPSSDDDRRAEGETVEQIAASLREPGRCSYVYLGKGLTTDAPADKVIALELLHNHAGDGINVLRADGMAEWLNWQNAQPLLVSLGLVKAEEPQR